MSKRTTKDYLDALKKVSRTFRSKDGKYHKPRKNLIYSSFMLVKQDNFGYKELLVKHKYCQRNTEKRLQKLRIGRKQIEGKTVLDLGCHAGNLLFELAKYKPMRCTGIEYDENKVMLARQIAWDFGLINYSFVSADIDTLQHIANYDVVFCMSVLHHVNNPEHLFQLLGKATRTGGILYFEGNKGTNPSYVADNLIEAGFREVTFIGFCDDDIRAENNVRPLFMAEK